MKIRFRKMIVLLLIPLMLINWSGAPANAASGSEQKVSPESVSVVHPNTVWAVEMPTLGAYLSHVAQDVENYWIKVINDRNGIFPPPDAEFYFPMRGESMGLVLCDPYTSTDDMTAIFCPYLSRVIVPQVLATMYWEGTYKRNNDPSQPYPAGDFSAAILVAHEFSHAVETYFRNDITLLRTKELLADCLTGVWTKSMAQRNQLEGNDLYEAMRTLHDVGDYSKLPTVHRGTPSQRYAAFTTGYTQGTMAGCTSYANGYAGN
ncbi:neutral zinc metallopeptidase [Planococcus sp. FY231025]|uniref:neutral zinc metallopeptidase n=1 Tax=Planococcus sp. FY231025 TaxID=3455699 RepID=UPI003F8ED2FB